MINLELAKKHQETFEQTMMLAEHMMRPFSRKYDKEEHAYPKEMEQVAELIGGARSEVLRVSGSRPNQVFHVDGVARHGRAVRCARAKKRNGRRKAEPLLDNSLVRIRSPIAFIRRYFRSTTIRWLSLRPEALRASRSRVRR